MDLSKDIQEQQIKKSKVKKTFPSKNLLGADSNLGQGSTSVEETHSNSSRKKPGRKPAFDGQETEDKFFTLPKSTTRLVKLAQLDLDYKTGQEFVNDAIVEFARMKGLNR